MLSPLQDYFHYSRGERKGTFILILIILLLISFYFWRDFVFQKEMSSADLEKFEKKIAAFKESAQNESVLEISYFMFDPNQIGVKEWQQLGFTEKQATSIENYKASGAVFKVKKDVLKLFMVDEFRYTQLEPYIDLPDNYELNGQDWIEEASPKIVYAILLQESEVPIYSGFDGIENVHYTKRDGVYQYVIMPFEEPHLAAETLEQNGWNTAKIIQLESTYGYYPVKQKSDGEAKESIGNELSQKGIDVNLADTTELKLLPGIGSSFANRIIKYRELLGGYCNLTQLTEVYGLNEDKYEMILPYLKITTNTIRKMDINELDTDGLKAHPYVDWKVANSIVQIRNNYGKFANIEEIKKSVLIDEDLFNKLKPYLEVK